ncbi:MAG: cytidylate kinase-like family protein [Clostridia bacterium]|nr:cytidylate kinase-like family protein [Clostridia bacterium]
MDKKIVITIARGYGSGGKTVGQMLSKELQIPFYDRQILYMASEDSGINLGLFQKNDEDVNKGLFDPSTHKYLGGIIPPEDSKFTSKENLFNYQAKIIKELASKESCVIVGRCADYILKDFDNVIKVFIWAPHQSCVETVMDMFDMNEKDADKKIKKIDRHRSEFYRYYTCREWDSARNYDLCLNSADLGFDGCVEAIKAYIEVLKNVKK